MRVSKPKKADEKLARSALMPDVWGVNSTKMDELFLVTYKGTLYFFGDYKNAEIFAQANDSMVSAVRWVSPKAPKELVRAMASANARAIHSDFVIEGAGGFS